MLYLVVESIRDIFPESKIKLLCILASEDGLKNVLTHYPGMEVGIVSYVRCHLSPWADMGRSC